MKLAWGVVLFGTKRIDTNNKTKNKFGSFPPARKGSFMTGGWGDHRGRFWLLGEVEIGGGKVPHQPLGRGALVLTWI